MRIRIYIFPLCKQYVVLKFFVVVVVAVLYIRTIAFRRRLSKTHTMSLRALYVALTLLSYRDSIWQWNVAINCAFVLGS